MKVYSEKFKTEIEFETTGEVLDTIDCYDHEEVVEGYDKEGNKYSGCGSVSCDELVNVYEIEKES